MNPSTTNAPPQTAELDRAGDLPSIAVPVTLQVNGLAHELVIDPRVSLLDALARPPAADRHEEGLQPGRVRRLHGAGGRRAHPVLPGARRPVRGPRHHDHRRAGERRGRPCAAGRVHRARRISVRLLHARPDLLGRRHAATNSRQGVPSAVTPIALEHRPTNLSDEELKERMSGNLCRCGAYVGICDAIRDGASTIGGDAMKPFAYARPTSARRRSTLVAQPANAKFLGGGTNLVDLMRENIEQPDALVDVTAPAVLARSTSAPDGGLSHRRRRAEHRGRARPAGARALSGAVAGDPVRRLGADPQHGDGRRQPDAAHALLLLLRRGGALQQAAARARAATRSTASTACTRFSARRDACIATHPSDMCVALAALDATVHVAGPHGSARFPSTSFIACPATRRTSRPSCRPGELITSVELAAARLRRALAVSQGARPSELCLRAGQRRRRRRDRATA